MSIILEVNNLNKTYKNFKAIDDISFQVNKGDIYGFLGPNGAGKKHYAENDFRINKTQFRRN